MNLLTLKLLIGPEKIYQGRSTKSPLEKYFFLELELKVKRSLETLGDAKKGITIKVFRQSLDRKNH